MPRGALEGMNQFHCVCVVPGGRCEALFLGGFCGILSPHHKYIHWSSEATGMGLSYLVIFLCIVSFTFSIMAEVGGGEQGGGVGYSLHYSVLGNFFL